MYVDSEVGGSSEALTVANGKELNGRELNGRELNGRQLNGVSLSGAFNASGTFSSLSLSGSQLVGTDATGAVRTGSQLVGAQFNGTFTTGEAVTLRIDSVTLTGTDVFQYGVSRLSAGTWGPLCPTSSTTSVPSIALAGRWDYAAGVSGGGSKIDDPASFTFACMGFGLAKCVMAGYKPWTSTSLAALHQACTRAIRADYCGNGSSYTLDGTLINVYDGQGVQADTESWPVEAEWDTAGARCLSDTRISKLKKVGGLPTCSFRHPATGCGQPAHFNSGALLITEAR